MDVQAYIDGRPVAIEDWQYDATTDWGYRTATFKVPESVTWAVQEAPVTFWHPDGEEAWAGKLALDPSPVGGKLDIRAVGYAETIAQQTDRMFYRVDGAGHFVGREDDPHNFGDNEKFDLIPGEGALRFKFGNNADAFAVGQGAGFATWFEGALITQYVFTYSANQALGTFNLITRTFTGPSGSESLEATHTLDPGGGFPQTVTQSISGPEDGLSIIVICSSAATPNGRRSVIVRGIKIYGRTTDDNFSASDVVADVGVNAGFDVARVEDAGLRVLPLDWEDDHTDLLSYMTALTGMQWQALGFQRPDRRRTSNPQLVLSDYGDIVTGYEGVNILPSFENQKRFNRARVPFRWVGGRAGRRIATADPDPFPGEVVEFVADELENSQTSGDLADAYAATLAAHYSQKRVAGRVEIAWVYDANGLRVDGAKVRPGWRLQIPDRPDLPDPQRIVGMTYRQGALPVAELNDEFNVIRLLARLQRQQRGWKKRGKGKGGRG